MIWRKAAERRFGSSISESVVLVFQVSMVLASLAFAYQNREILESMVRDKLAVFSQ